MSVSELRVEFLIFPSVKSDVNDNSVTRATSLRSLLKREEIVNGIQIFTLVSLFKSLVVLPNSPLIVKISLMLIKQSIDCKI